MPVQVLVVHSTPPQIMNRGRSRIEDSDGKGVFAVRSFNVFRVLTLICFYLLTNPFSVIRRWVSSTQAKLD
jgi:hypothetical protein